VAALINIPTTVYKTPSLTTFLQGFVVVCFPDDSHSDWVEMESQCSFDVHFPDG
jgi:hypothetical protein